MFLIKNLKYKLQSFELSCPELQFESRGITAIRGPSGSGKTTFFKILIGEYSPQGWSWQLNGIELANTEVSERQLGVIFQSYELFPHLTAEENIKIIMKARNNFSSLAKAQLEKFKQQLQLGFCWHTRAENLSGGEKQRTAVLRAIMSKPKLILMDEPFSALDASLRHESRALVKTVIDEAGIPALMITHDEEDCHQLADRTIQMADGRFL